MHEICFKCIVCVYTDVHVRICILTVSDSDSKCKEQGMVLNVGTHSDV